MPTENQAGTQILTRDQWLKVLSQHRASGWPSRHPLSRRKEPRYPTRAFATLTTASVDGCEENTICVRCPVLDASSESLTIRTHQTIPLGAVLSIELHIGDKRLRLSGKVIHSTGFPGSVRVGIALELTEIGTESEEGGS